MLLHVPDSFRFTSLAKQALRNERGSRKYSFFEKSFSDFFGKSIDGANAAVPAGTLSLRGRLFEIYFVRLIGTPNQNSKYDADSGRYQVSSSRITRF